MATKKIKLKDPAGNILYPQTKASLLLNDDGTPGAPPAGEKIKSVSNSINGNIITTTITTDKGSYTSPGVTIPYGAPEVGEFTMTDGTVVHKKVMVQ